MYSSLGIYALLKAMEYRRPWWQPEQRVRGGHSTDPRCTAKRIAKRRRQRKAARQQRFR